MISLKIILFLWQCKLIDTFTAVQFIYNAGPQYSAMVVAAMSDGNFTKFPMVLFEPIAGFGVSYQFVKAAQNAAERRARVATLAALLSASTASTVGSNAATSATVGAAVAAHIAHMRDALAVRGGSSTVNSVVKVLDVKVSEIHPFRAEFTSNSKMIIKNIFEEHAARRYLQASSQKIKIIRPTYLTPIASTQINTTALIGWIFCGVGLIGFLTLSALYLFQRAERKRYINQNDEILIDVTASLSD